MSINTQFKTYGSEQLGIIELPTNWSLRIYAVEDGLIYPFNEPLPFVFKTVLHTKDFTEPLAYAHAINLHTMP